ncbi:glycosyltransferase family 4 protein [Frankia sp. Cpl3]|nr:glycosyltransferase family 4 protein [Frankia sp. Cpl3]
MLRSSFRRKVATREPTQTPCRVLLLAPSQGLGGGIERYLSTVEECLRAGGAEVHRIDMLRPEQSLTAAHRIRFALRVVYTGLRLGQMDCVTTGHRNMIPLGAVVARIVGARMAPIVFYGNDIWELRRSYRALVSRSATLFPLTISSYSSGALSTLGLAPILPPGIAPAWRTTLIEEGRRQRAPAAVPTVLSVFRLPAWEDKGLHVLVEALAAIRQRTGPVRLVVAGHGPLPGALRDFTSAHPELELHENPDDHFLASLYGEADLFALCTRTIPPSTGEGYGIVLLEAQLAGCPVVGPAFGGSYDAYQEGLTGVTPADESSEALAAVLLDLLTNRPRLARMSSRAAEWAVATTDPAEYTRKAVTALTGTPPADRPHLSVPMQRAAVERLLDGLTRS